MRTAASKSNFTICELKNGTGVVLRIVGVSLVLFLFSVVTQAERPGLDCELKLVARVARIEATKREMKPLLKEAARVEQESNEGAARAAELRVQAGQLMAETSLAVAAMVGDEILIYRSFNPSSIPHFTDRLIRPKMMLPLKTANTGLVAGLVPYDVRLTKAGENASLERIAQLQAGVDQLLSKGTLRIMALTGPAGTAVVREEKQVWTKRTRASDLLLYILTDTLGRRLVGDIDLFDIGRKQPASSVEWTAQQGFVSADDRRTIEQINSVFRPLHPGLGSPDLVVHGGDRNLPSGYEHHLDFPLIAFLPSGTKYTIEAGPL